MKYACFIIGLLMAAISCQAQQNDPLFELHYCKKFCAPFALDEKPNVRADTNLIAIWKMQEDKDSHNYFVLERHNFYEFVFTYMNRGGANRTYENYGAFFSKIGGAYFLNVLLFDHETSSMKYFFLKVTDLDSRGWDMTLWLVADTTLNNIASRDKLRERLTKNVNNRAYYAPPVHFHKVLPLMYCE